MRDVSELNRKRIESTQAIITFLRKNVGKAFPREEILEKTGHDPYYMRHPVFSFDDFAVENGYYYYELDWFKVSIVLLYVFGLTAILLLT